ncbi:hypothetical protein BU17DRAFT_61593 [Hysterangium stoloniferum]|nr:hypothetical protein BU17DRAFT_61593 [Hysterangium stoloniferum]
MQSLSPKKLGKRPQPPMHPVNHHLTLRHDMEHNIDVHTNNNHNHTSSKTKTKTKSKNNSSRSNASPRPMSPAHHQQHQKRVLPTRSRRGGGPNVGNSGVDMLIIDTERRNRDAKPSVAPEQPFFLTTHAGLVPRAQEGDADTESYFDQPEVRAACLAQEAIQVPHFEPLPDDAVGGRLRARAEEEGPETSDAAYVSRHRKYETFEKRQRRREKEKLVHEQFKLKERIDQLRGMDASAFGTGGETRRKEMLDVAIALERRYAVLLPPEPKRANKKGEKKRGKGEGLRTGTTTGDDADTEEEQLVSPQPPELVRPVPVKPILVLRGDKEKGKEKVVITVSTPPPQPSLPPPSPVPSVPPPPAVSVAIEANVVPNVPHRSPYIAASAFNAPTEQVATIQNSESVAHVATKSENGGSPPPEHLPPTPSVSAPAPSTEPSIPPPPPRKRQRKDPHRVNTPEAPAYTQSVLLQIAARKAAQPQARQTTRVLMAFGFRVPIEVDDQMDYELPPWLMTRDELEDIHLRRTHSATRSASPRSAARLTNGIREPAGPGSMDAISHFETGRMDIDPTHPPAGELLPFPIDMGIGNGRPMHLNGWKGMTEGDIIGRT